MKNKILTVGHFKQLKQRADSSEFLLLPLSTTMGNRKYRDQAFSTNWKKK